MRHAINNYKQGKKTKITKANRVPLRLCNRNVQPFEIAIFYCNQYIIWLAVSIAKFDMLEMSPRQKSKKKREQNEWTIQDNIKSTIICKRDSHEVRRIKDKRDLNMCLAISSKSDECIHS